MVKLQKLQKQVARIITRKGYDERLLYIQKQLSWMTWRLLGINILLLFLRIFFLGVISEPGIGYQFPVGNPIISTLQHLNHTASHNRRQAIHILQPLPYSPPLPLRIQLSLSDGYQQTSLHFHHLQHVRFSFDSFLTYVVLII